VIGDRETGRYVPDGVAEAIRETLVPRADLLAPNVFELERLSGARVQGMSEAFDAAAALRAEGPARIVVTGLDDGHGRIASAMVDRTGAWLASTPRVVLDRRPDGAGDLLAAVLLARLLDGVPAPDALAHAMAAVHDLLALTVERGARELCLIEGQALLAHAVGRADVIRVG
jgi:pyridoxine kinase